MHYHKEQIRGLLFEKLTGTISPSDEQWLDEAMVRSEEIRKEWLAIQTQFDTTKATRFLETADPDKAWENVLPHLEEDKSLRNIKGKAVKTVAVAACLVMLVGLFLWKRPDSSKEQRLAQEVYIEKKDGSKNMLQREVASVEELLSENKIDSNWNTLVVPAGKNYKLALTDGTEIWLNSSSKIRFSANLQIQKIRKVWIEGEAFFKVAQHPDKPFMVETPFSTIEVLGTSFNVHAYQKEGSSTALVEGAVKTQLDGTAHLLKPGYQLQYRKGDIRILPFDEKEICAWMQGLYFFHETNLAEIIPVLERWFDVKIVLTDKRLGNRHFTGAIDKHQPLKTALETLAISGNLNIYEEGNQVYIK